MKFLIAFLSALLLSTSALAQFVGYQAHIRGEFEVPPINTPITGEFLFRNSDNRYFLAVRGVPVNDRILAATLQCGKKDDNGPILYEFYFGVPSRRISPKGQFNDSKFIPYQTSSVCPYLIRTIADLKTAIQFEIIYVNIHTQRYPAGVARGLVTTIIP